MALGAEVVEGAPGAAGGGGGAMAMGTAMAIYAGWDETGQEISRMHQAGIPGIY